VINVDLGLDLVKTINPALMTPAAWILEANDIDNWRPTIPASAAKWDRGHVGIIGGGGAATLAAHGAFRGGAGLVTLFAPKSMWKTFHGLWPEVILAEPESMDPSRHDVIVVGPGLGTTDVDTVCNLWSTYPGAVVADADAINILAAASALPSSQFPRLLTPHTAEAARLLGITRAQVENNRMAAIAALGDMATSILKGPHTLIAAGECIWINPTGSNRLATAGTGDVLAGMVGGCLAAGSTPEQALAIAVWDHGLAGALMPPQGTATDLLMALQSPHLPSSSLREDPSR
jgi:NAD(P)H-hydrate epimerase